MKILSIDDDHFCLQAVSKCLSFSGEHIIETAENGQEGVKKAIALVPDLILLDLRMPGMDGIQVMDILSSDPRTMTIPVVLLTGATLAPEQYDSLLCKNNFLMFEQKPCDLNGLVDRASALMTGAQELPGGARKRQGQ